MSRSAEFYTGAQHERQEYAAPEAPQPTGRVQRTNKATISSGGGGDRALANGWSQDQLNEEIAWSKYDE